MNTKYIQEYCALYGASKELLKTAMKRLNLSVRAYDRILKVARTIADLDDASHVVSGHIVEAIRYRSLDRDWGSFLVFSVQFSENRKQKIF